MSGLYHWVGNIAFYLIFMTVIGSILPSRKYDKYVRLFAGMVLILLVLKPLTSGLRLEDKIAYSFEANTFRSESQELEDQILGIEKQRFEEMIANYEEAVEKDVAAMALDLGFYCVNVHVTIEADRESPDYGKVRNIEMTVSRERETGGQESVAGVSKEPDGSVQIEPVEPVEIGDNGETKEARTAAMADDMLNRLRRKVEQYYELETVDVQIRLEE